MWYNEKNTCPGFLILNLPFTGICHFKKENNKILFTSCGKGKLDMGMKVLINHKTMYCFLIFAPFSLP